VRPGTLIRVRLLRPGARVPFRATGEASGFDLYACLDRPVTVGQYPAVVPTGVAMEVPPGFDAQIRPRSGLARQGVLCTFGTLDADYRGELMVTMYTMAAGIEHVIHDGDRIAQVVITQLAEVALEVAEELSATARGEGGHGSKGR